MGVRVALSKEASKQTKKQKEAVRTTSFERPIKGSAQR